MGEDILDGISVIPAMCCHSWQVIDTVPFVTLRDGIIPNSYVEECRCRICGLEKKMVVSCPISD